MSRKSGENCDLVSVSVGGSYEDQENHKSVRYLFPKDNPTINVTVTSSPDHNSVHIDDDEENYLPILNLSTTEDE